MAGERRSQQHETPQALWLETLQAATAVLGSYEAIIDDQAIPDEGGRAQQAAEGWASKFAQLAERMCQADEPASMVRRVAYANVQADMMDDIMRASVMTRISPQEAVNRLNANDDPIGRMPFLGQLRQLMYMRMRNAGQRWEANDLVDIMFLCCAVGYADLVVGERRTVGYLRQARQPPPPAKTATSLREALDLLEQA